MNKRIYLLGAGSSKHLGYPTGSELIKKIIAITAKDNSCLVRDIPYVKRKFKYNIHKLQDSETYYKIIVKAANSLGIDESLINDFNCKLRNSFQSIPSIDIFLSNLDNQQLQEIGKLAITMAILECENPCDKRNWYSQLVKGFYPSNGLNYDFSKMVIFTFNYDRSLDCFIHDKIRDYHKIVYQQIGKDELIIKEKEALSTLKILHVYGCVDPLVSTDSTDNISLISDYGDYKNLLSNYSDESKRKSLYDMIIAGSKNISTIYENNEGKANIEIGKYYEEFRELCIFGFGFHDSNLERVGINIEKKMDVDRIYSTGYGLSESDKGKLHTVVVERESPIEIKFGEYNQDVNEFYKTTFG